MSAKELVVLPITRRDADAFMRRQHYSGKVVRNASLHLGVYWRERLEGVLQFGPSLDKRKIRGLVEGTEWNGFIELNRMAFTAALPRNSESRALSVAMRIIRKHYPWIEWVISFADATQCGDGTIYRAAGFVLTSIKVNKSLIRLANGSAMHEMTLVSSPTSPRPELGGRSWYDLTGGKRDLHAYARAVGGEVLTGYQLRYLYFLNPAARARLRVPVIPFAAIAEQGAGMYKGVRRAKDHDPADLAGVGGETPTRALHPSTGEQG